MTIFLENPLGMQWLMFSKISECFTRNTIDKILKPCEEIVLYYSVQEYSDRVMNGKIQRVV